VARREAAAATHQTRLVQLEAECAAAAAAEIEAEAAAKLTQAQAKEARIALHDVFSRAVAEMRAKVAGKREEAAATATRVAARVGRAAAAAKAARQTRDKEELFRLEQEAAQAPYDRLLGPGHSPAAYERDRRRLAQEVGAVWRRCAACERGEPHSAEECVLTMGLLKGSAVVREPIIVAPAPHWTGGPTSESHWTGGASSAFHGQSEVAAVAAGYQMDYLALSDQRQWNPDTQQLDSDIDDERALKAAIAWMSKVGGGDGRGKLRSSQYALLAGEGSAAGADSHYSSQPESGPLSVATALGDARGSAGVATAWARAAEDLGDGARGELESLRLDRKDLTEVPTLGSPLNPKP